jgi:hypothetical protein
VEHLALTLLLLFALGALWMWKVGRTGPRALNALAEMAVFAALPVGPFVWLALRRQDERRRW